jgi:aspartyl-tRNA(Asn)/glutamyl-tRNA(Gln) amidotransferase subunit C
MSIKREEILHLLEMSGLSLSDVELDNLEVDLGNIIGYISQLNELDTEGIEPTYQVFEMQNVWREDEIEEFEAERDDLLKLSAETLESQIKVPRIL